jgi:serine/threonine-protein kinase
MLGRVLAGRFTILARIGSGSMGTVYRANQSPIGRDVAIKILRSDRAIDEVSRVRFTREARANSVLTSPNTVTVFDFGQSETGDFYLAMELLEGESLGQRIARVGRIPLDDALDTAKQALRSLAEAHAKGIIHRDLKPDNLFYARVQTNETYEEIVKVLDFGIAKMLNAEGELGMNAIETQAGTVFGTPRYMSPEQAQGKPLDARSDLYSLGVILYHMLTGRPPFMDDDAIVVMARHIKTMPRAMSEVAPDARIPADVEALVMRVLSKEPDRRPDSAESLAAELTRLRENAVVSSGVRVSVDRRSDAPPERAPSVAPPPPPTSSALTNDPQSSVTFTGRARHRWPYVVTALGLAAAASLGVKASVRRTTVPEPSHAATLAAQESQLPVEPQPPPIPSVADAVPSQGAGPSLAAAPRPSDGSPVTTSSSLPAAEANRVVPRASASSLRPLSPVRAGSAPPNATTAMTVAPFVPTAQAMAPGRADVRTEKVRAVHSPLPGGSARPSSSSSVGYGYLE